MNKELVFYSLLDFYPKRNTIKENFDLLTVDEKITYKMYVYSIPFEEEYTKDLIWEFLNGWNEGIFELGKKYRIKKNKYEKRRKYEMQHNPETEQLERDNWSM